MRHRFYLPAGAVPGSSVTIAGEELHHARVVRLREGEEIELFDGRGGASAGVVKTLGRDEMTVDVLRAIGARESPVAIDLAMAIIALEKFELVLQKATELGVRSIIPLVTERVELRPERYRGKGERWQKIVFEAVKQCGRAVVPQVTAPLGFEEALRREGVKVLFDADAEPGSVESGVEAMTLFTGPEGGWSDDELRRAREAGFVFQKLGPRRLRAETAAIAGLAVMGLRVGDIG